MIYTITAPDGTPLEVEMDHRPTDADKQEIYASVGIEVAPVAVDTIPEAPEVAATQTPIPEEQASEGRYETAISGLLPSMIRIPRETTSQKIARPIVGAMDVLDVPKRALAYITGQGEMTDPEANVWAKPRQIWRDYMDRRIDRAEGQTFKRYAIGAGMPASGYTPEIVEYDQKDSEQTLKELGDAIFEVAGDPILVAGLMKVLGKTVLKPMTKAMIEAPRKYAGAISRGLTKIPEETLTKYATKEGRQEMAKAFGQEAPTSEALVRKVYKQKLPEEDLVNTFIEQADNISIDPLIKNLEKAKKAIKFKKTNKDAINAIDDLIEDYRGLAKNTDGKITAQSYRELRQELDDVLGDIYQKEGLGLAQKAFKNIRKDMKDALIKASPAEYKNVMAEYARKMNARSEIKELLGKSSGWRAKKKAEALIMGVDRKGRTQEKIILEKFDDLYQTNFTRRSETMAEARKIAAEPLPPSGEFEASLFPKIATGWGKLGVAVVGLGWPKTAGSILNKLEALTRGAKSTILFPEKLVRLLESGGETVMVQTLATGLKQMKLIDRIKLEQDLKQLEKAKRTGEVRQVMTRAGPGSEIERLQKSIKNKLKEI